MTILFCDVVGSTALGEVTDPEAVRSLLVRYFDRMSGIIEAHGGVVEKFIGDAVMAVFGVPQAHEDDALRAVRAAAVMRDALPELGVEARIGVNTGEVVTSNDEWLATGDAVNVAARLEQAAASGEVLLGEQTFALVGGAVSCEALEPLTLKGKAAPVPAFRLVAVHETPGRRHVGRFVGRTAELAVLRNAWRNACERRSCELVTVVGHAGVGKSRLVSEFLSSEDVRALSGRCLPYGEGITYWPVVEVVRQLDALPSDSAAAASLRSLLGETHIETSTDEIAWAFRKLVEEQAPFLCVFDDLQWGEESFLDLVEHVALLSRAPVLLLCLARPELADRRPQWPATIKLEPLPRSDVDELIPETTSTELRERIIRAAGGNPLFVIEMLAMAEGADGDLLVPPTLKALLAARLDQLKAAVRRVLECGAIEGELFHRGAVQALEPDDSPVTPRLAALVRQELVRPESALIAGEDGFRFRHVLIRDAAYEGLPKGVRAELHERFADWLAAHGRELLELDEILGHHLERAWRYRRELAQPGERRLAAAARERLTAAEQRAMSRQDYPAAAKFAERALALVPSGEVDAALEVDRLDAAVFSGNGERGLAAAATAIERAVAAGDRTAELTLRGVHMIWEAQLGAVPDSDGRIDPFIQEALPELERASSVLGLHQVYWLAGYAALNRGQADAAFSAFETSHLYGHRLGRHYPGWTPRQLVIARALGTTPVAESLAWLEELEAEGVRLGVRRVQAVAKLGRAEALSMLTRFDEAERLIAEVRAEWLERSALLDLAQNAAIVSRVQLLAENAAEAETYLADAWTFAETRALHGILPDLAVQRAFTLCELQRLEEASHWAGRAAELADTAGLATRIASLRARAKVFACTQELEAASATAREAIELAEETDFLNARADVRCQLAEALQLSGNSDAAAVALRDARDLYARKGNQTMTERAQTQLVAVEKAHTGS